VWDAKLVDKANHEAVYLIPIFSAPDFHNQLGTRRRI
jgi:hypothetical protein